MSLEKRGIATVTLCTEAFAALARAEATHLGLPGLPLVLIPHPMASRTPAEVAAVAGAVQTAVLTALRGQAPATTPYQGELPHGVRVQAD